MGNFVVALVNCWSECFFVTQTAIISMLYEAVRGKFILGWVTFKGYLTLPSHTNFTQTDIVYPALVWLPSLGVVTQPRYCYPAWVLLPSLSTVTQAG